MESKIQLVAKEIVRLLECKDGYPICDLYHYTDMSALEGILSTRRLWMTRYDSLDDESEIKYAHQEASKIIDSQITATNNREFWEYFAHKFRDVLKIGDYFICSFSHSPSNMKLWNEYAKQGGAAIKFCKEYFAPTATMNKRRRRYNLTTVQNVQYEIKEFKERVEKLFSVVEGALEVGNSQLNRELGACLITYFMTDMPKVKKEGFLSENECRLYQYGFNAEMNGKADKEDRIYAIPQVERSNKKRVLKKFKQKDIHEIIVDSTEHNEKIMRLLHEYQFTGVNVRSRT